jgi:hypothetical protein
LLEQAFARHVCDCDRPEVRCPSQRADRGELGEVSSTRYGLPA